MSPIQDSEYKALKPKPGHMALEALPRVPDRPRQPWALPKTAQDEPKRSSGQSQELLWLPGMAHHECLGVDLDCLDMTHVGALRPQGIQRTRQMTRPRDSLAPRRPQTKPKGKPQRAPECPMKLLLNAPK